MRGDIDGDGKITQNDRKQISEHLGGTITLTGADSWCAKIAGNNEISVSDLVQLMQYLEGKTNTLTGTPTFADYYNNWTYHKVDDLTGYWTAEIAVNGLKATSDAIVNISNDEGIFYKSELSDGAIRFYATRPPIAEVPATITFKPGTGVITTSYESAKFHAATHSKDGADPITPTAIGAVGYDVAQNLTDAQKTQARGNIGAAPGGYGGDGETLPFYNLADDTGDLLKAKLIELSNDDTVTKPFKKHFTFRADPFLGTGWNWLGELLSGQNSSGFKRLFLHGYNWASATQHMWMTAFENDNHEWKWNGPYWQSLDNLPDAQYLTKHIWKGQFGGKVGWYRITNNFSIYNSPCLVSISHQYNGGSSAGVLLHITPDTSVGNILCLKSNGATLSYGNDNAPIINARLIDMGSGYCALDIYTKISNVNSCTISVQNEGSNNVEVIEPKFISADDTLPNGETLRNTMAWQNPPLIIGQEYKVAELCDNREVYVKLVNCGDFAVGKNIQWYDQDKLSEILYPVSIDVFNRRMTFPDSYISGSNIVLQGSDSWGGNLSAYIKYVKDPT